MIDPADQRVSDEAIKRTTNLTPTEVRVSLNATAIDFQRRVDAAQSITPTVSTPKAPAEITSRETKFDGQPVVLPTISDVSGQDAGPFPSPQNPPAPIGSSASPYVMGQNRTTTDPVPADDSWTLAGGPSPSGGGPFTGVQVLVPRFYIDPSGAQDTFNDTLGNPVTINIFTVYVFSRSITYDSVGAIVAIGPETAYSGAAFLTNVSFS